MGKNKRTIPIPITKTRRTRHSRISQGDVIKNIEYIEYIKEKKGILEISRITFPLAIVLTQDCDLLQDYKYRNGKESKTGNKDKYLMSVLVAPLYNAEHVFAQEHLSELKMKTSQHPRIRVEDNEIARFHYLKFSEEDMLSPVIIDFKHYFSVNIEYLKKIKAKDFVFGISALHREKISHRFAHFLSRVGLPDIKEKKRVEAPEEESETKR